MNTIKKFNAIVKEPKNQHRYSIIWLHGLGADGHDFVPIIPELNLDDSLGVRFIFPNAPKRPVTINHGHVMPAWYDITALHTENQVNMDDIKTSIALIKEYIEHEATLGIPLAKIFIAGFSQGAAIALLSGLTYQPAIGGIIALSGYLPNASAFFPKPNVISKPPIFIAHGTEDQVVPHLLGNRACAFLENMGLEPNWHSYTMGHTVSPLEVKDVRKWLLKQMNDE